MIRSHRLAAVIQRRLPRHARFYVTEAEKRNIGPPGAPAQKDANAHAIDHDHHGVGADSR